MEKLKITPGEWKIGKIDIQGTDYRSGCIHINSPTWDEFINAKRHIGDSSDDEAIANAQLIAEAGTVANETGKTPRRLAEENKLLLEALTAYYKVYKELGIEMLDTKMSQMFLDAEAAIKSTTE